MIHYPMVCLAFIKLSRLIKDVAQSDCHLQLSTIHLLPAAVQLGGSGKLTNLHTLAQVRVDSTRSLSQVILVMLRGKRIILVAFWILVILVSRN